MNYTLHNEDCLNVLRNMDSESVDILLTDPPYGLSDPPDPLEVLNHWLDGARYQHKSAGFMGADWDSFVPGPAVWSEVLRVLKTGSYGLVFSGTRTVDLMQLALEIAGFQILGHLQWLYGNGFPKSHNISKAIDKRAGAEREVVGVKPGHEEFANRKTKGHLKRDKGSQKGFDRPWMHQEQANSYHLKTAPATTEAQRWEGYGTALKPAHEPIIVVQKPGPSVALQLPPFLYRSKASSKERMFYCRECEGVFDRSQRKKHKNSNIDIHPTQKPLDLMENLAELLISSEEDVVLDPFMGSGTTGVGVAKKAHFVGIDLNPSFVHIAKHRIDKAYNDFSVLDVLSMV